MAVLFALVLGVYGAVSINTFRPARMQPMAPPAPSAVTVSPPPAPAPAVAIPLEQINPTAGHTFEAAKPAYWIEYGAYRGSFYAQKLLDRLGTIGLKAKIKRVRGAGGALYYSVRSSGTADRSNADANANAKLAAQLGIAPLLHRGDNRVVAQPVVAKIAPAATSPAAHYIGFNLAPTTRGAMQRRCSISCTVAALKQRFSSGTSRVTRAIWFVRHRRSAAMKPTASRHAANRFSTSSLWSVRRGRGPPDRTQGFEFGHVLE